MIKGNEKDSYERKQERERGSNDKMIKSNERERKRAI